MLHELSDLRRADVYRRQQVVSKIPVSIRIAMLLYDTDHRAELVSTFARGMEIAMYMKCVLLVWGMAVHAFLSTVSCLCIVNYTTNREVQCAWIMVCVCFVFLVFSQFTLDGKSQCFHQEWVQQSSHNITLFQFHFMSETCSMSIPGAPRPVCWWCLLVNRSKYCP